MDIWVQLATSVLGSLIGALTMYIMLKRTINDDKILEISDLLLNEVSQNEEYQKKLYLIGAIIGNGVKQGIGIPRTTGKFKIKDLLGQIVAGWVQQRMIQPQTTITQQGKVEPIGKV